MVSGKGAVNEVTPPTSSTVLSSRRIAGRAQSQSLRPPFRIMHRVCVVVHRSNRGLQVDIDTVSGEEGRGVLL